MELGAFNVEFLPQIAVKGQVLADFLVEFCDFLEEKELPLEDACIAYVDGSSTQKRSGARKVLTGPKDVKVEIAI
jgi:hypothetical protein